MSTFTIPTPPTPPNIATKSLKAVIVATDSSTHGGDVPVGDPMPMQAANLHVTRETDTFICGITPHNSPTDLEAPVLSVYVADHLNALKNLDTAVCGAQMLASQTVLKTEECFIRITSPSTV